MKFIKLTLLDETRKIYIRADKIESIINETDDCDMEPHSIVTHNNGRYFGVTETPEQIIEMIEKEENKQDEWAKDEYKKMEESFKPIPHEELDEWATNNPPGSGPHTDEELRKLYFSKRIFK